MVFRSPLPQRTSHNPASEAGPSTPTPVPTDGDAVTLENASSSTGEATLPSSGSSGGESLISKMMADK